jgi:nitrogen fixation NifU-like protein
MMDLRELYQEVILDHSREPRNFGAPERANRAAKGDNPLCGDRVSVHLLIEDGTVTEVGFEGRGCAISMASASLMTEAVKGKTEAQARELFARFRAMVMSDGEGEEGDFDDLEKLNVLAGVRDFPVRVKCATLPWHTLSAAMNKSADDVSTE